MYGFAETAELDGQFRINLRSVAKSYGAIDITNIVELISKNDFMNTAIHNTQDERRNIQRAAQHTESCHELPVQTVTIRGDFFDAKVFFQQRSSDLCNLQLT
jgi:hypothetical protein